jgi:hypothetical protein
MTDNFEECDQVPPDPFATIANRFERLAARTQATLDAWAAQDAAEDPRVHLAERTDSPESRRYGFARGEGWCLGAGGIEDFKAEGEGVIDGHVIYYRAYGSEQTDHPDWGVTIAPVEYGSAVMVGWSAGGLPGWIIEGSEADDPELPKVTTRAGAWARMDRVVAAFRAGTMRRFEPITDTDYPLARRLLLDTGGIGAGTSIDEAWLDTPHPALGGRTPDRAVHDGEYTRVNALVLAERFEALGY